MFYYNWREMLVWITLFVIALTIIIMGFQSSDSSGTLRLAVGPKDSFQHRIGEDFKRLIERRTPYKVLLVHGENSLANQRELLDHKVDAALVAPVALPSFGPLLGVAPLASLYAHVLVGSNSKVDSLYAFKDGEIAASSPPASALLAAMDLGSRHLISFGDVKTEASAVARLMVDHFSANNGAAWLQDKRLLPLREAVAVQQREPLWVPAVIPAWIYSDASQQSPAESVNTLATPLVLAVLPDVDMPLVAEVIGVLNSLEGRALAARYNQPDTEAAWQWLPKHPAAGGDSLLARDVLRQELAWWLQHKPMILLVLLGLGLVAWQSWNLHASRNRLRLKVIQEEVEGLMSQLLGFEQRVSSEHDLRSLYQLLDDVNLLKLRGSKLMLGTRLVHDPLLGTFHQQCNHVAGLIEKRLQGKAPLSVAA